jgi:hypothetical protein
LTIRLYFPLLGSNKIFMNFDMSLDLHSIEIKWVRAYDNIHFFDPIRQHARCQSFYERWLAAFLCSWLLHSEISSKSENTIMKKSSKSHLKEC